MTTLLIMTDGRRECLIPTLASLHLNLTGNIHRTLIHDDSGSATYAAWLRKEWPWADVFSTGQRSGFAGAIQSAWEQVDGDWIVHWEDDFVLKEKVNVASFVAVMRDNPDVVQMALKRQPWNEAEKAAGGFIEMSPYDYIEKTDGKHTWTEHRKFFTTNPSVYRGSLIKRGWPNVPESEGVFGASLFRDEPNARAAYWGGKFEAPKVEHIGIERAGNGY